MRMHFPNKSDTIMNLVVRLAKRLSFLLLITMVQFLMFITNVLFKLKRPNVDIYARIPIVLLENIEFFLVIYNIDTLLQTFSDS